jgi:cytochrome c
MNTMELNKGVAALLIAGLVFAVAGQFGNILVKVVPLEKSAITIEVASATAAPPEKPKSLGVLLAAADPARGKMASLKNACIACHTFDQGGKAGVGPNLYNVVGGPRAHMPGYDYSGAMKAKGGTWTYESLNEWLTKPAAFLPGTKMTFLGVASPEERADIIAYLRSLTPDAPPLPAAN